MAEVQYHEVISTTSNEWAHWTVMMLWSARGWLIDNDDDISSRDRFNYLKKESDKNSIVIMKSSKSNNNYFWNIEVSSVVLYYR